MCYLSLLDEYAEGRSGNIGMDASFVNEMPLPPWYILHKVVLIVGT